MRLPSRYEPLLLTFYGREARQSDGDVIIGDDYGTDLHVRPDGAVYSIDPRGKLPTRFVNSSVEQLARFVEVVSGANRADDDRERAMWEMLAQIDPPAFADEAWWAVVREQAQYEAGW